MLKLKKITVKESLFVTDSKDPGHRKKQLKFQKLTRSRPLL